MFVILIVGNITDSSLSGLVFKGNRLIFYLNSQILTSLVSDTSVELSIQDDCFLTDIPRLILEINLNGQVVCRVNLLSAESSPGVWNADRMIVL
jgi:hypothetical protein